MSGPGRFGAHLRHWHRRIGLLAGLFLIWLALSGLVLNEGSRFGLDGVRIQYAPLMRWYGLDGASTVEGYRAGAHWLVNAGDETLLDGTPLNPRPETILGAAATTLDGHAVLFLATVDDLVLIDDGGQLIEKLNTASLPIHSIRRIGLGKDGQIVIQDLDAYTSRDGETWTAATLDDVHWSTLEPLPDAARNAAAAHLQPSLPLTRVLADAHSGRLFGRLGPLIIDLVAIGAILLALSGLWMIWRASRRRHHG